MDFRTKIDLPKTDLRLTHNDRCIFLGSCFAENIGNKLVQTKIPCSVNPTGILYNPLSIQKSIINALSKKKYQQSDIFFANGKWNCYDFHSRFSNVDADECLNAINFATQNLNNKLLSADFLFVTFGTAYVYSLAQTHEIVCNCHKQAEKIFNRYLLKVEQIVSGWRECIDILHQLNPKLQIIFTVSPIRHSRDGYHQNQVSKSTLHLAVHQINAEFMQTSYFPAYEIVIDELRDYRFYASDMLHPSEVAVDYIWEKFGEVYFSAETEQVNKQVAKIVSAAQHKPFNSELEEYRQFCKKNLALINELSSKYEYLDFREEKLVFSGT